MPQSPDGRRWCCGLLPVLQLRQKRGFKWEWFYYWAAASNLVGRLSWALSINPNSITALSKSTPLLTSPQVCTTLPFPPLHVQHNTLPADIRGVHAP